MESLSDEELDELQREFQLWREKALRAVRRIGQAKEAPRSELLNSEVNQ